MTVLLIDDAEVNLRVYERIIANVPSASARSFTSSAAALAWCGHEEPDLIVLDYRMPPPDGIEFIARYNDLRPDSGTPIVMITSAKDKSVRHRALELGASDFIEKPADPVEFLARVRNLLALRESRLALRKRADTLAQEVARATREVVEREEETIDRLMRAAEFRDNDTGMHIVRMGEFAAALGTQVGLSESDCRLLRLATPMHDIGKVATPDRILLKPGPLTADEWKVMREHTTAGYEILKGSSSTVIQVAAEIAYGHHEHYDGSGYPRGLSAIAIPLSARICAVADVFDALTSERPYKPAWDPERAFGELERIGGTHLDPQLTTAFVGMKERVLALRARFSDAPATLA